MRIAPMRRLVACPAFLALSLLSACSDSPSEGDGTLITVTTTAPTSTLVPGGRVAATWAGFRSADGSWVKLDPASGSERGKYTFHAKGDRWTVAFACSDGDMALVAIHEDLVTTTSHEVELDRWCAPEPRDGFTVSGTLSHLPGEVGWLDFGYELEARGAVLPNDGTTANYEQVNIAPGTWDLALGVRSDSTTVLSKIAILRHQTVAADARLDVDLATALTPGTKGLIVRGLQPANIETLAAPVQYTTNNGDKGLDVGPPTFEQTGADVVTTTYSTIPPEAQLPTDRYRFSLVANGDVGDSGELTQRGATAILHDAIDVDITLAPALGAPSLTPIAQGSFARVTAKTPLRPRAASYELSALAKITNRRVHVWRITMNAALVAPGATDAVLTLPDLFPVTGFDPSWGLPSDMRREVTIKATDAPLPLGDGTITYYVSHTTIVRPRD